MKQPELGRKISELRKEKGLTQEELVDKCNISVRTLQRIESGEVTPRSYTVRTIMAALEYDLARISDKDDKEKNLIDWLKDILLIDIDPDKTGYHLVKQLKYSWIFGLIYFVLGFLEGAADYYRISEDQMVFSIPFYIILKILVLISFFFFQRGFILVGHLLKNYLLKIMSFVIIFGMFLVIIYDITSLFQHSIEREFILGAQALTFGAIGILYGVSLLKLQRTFGQKPIIAGIFEIFAACFLLTILLAFIGLIILIPAELLEIIILYKAAETIKSLKSENEIITA